MAAWQFHKLHGMGSIPILATGVIIYGRMAESGKSARLLHGSP